MKVEPWKCYARPAHMGGRECGQIAKGMVGGPMRVLCCEHCGATKIASDSRLARKVGAK